MSKDFDIYKFLAQRKKHSDRIVQIYGKPEVPLKVQLEPLPPPPLDLPPLAKPIVDSFNPSTFEEYIGQERAKDIASIIVESANIDKRPIPNLLIFGPYGLGKTTLARLIMEKHGQPYRFMDAVLAAKLEFFKDYMIIDEIHNLPPEICDQLNTIMDQGEIHLIGCTTNSGALPAPFRSRLRTIHLEEYQTEHIYKIIENVVLRKKIKAESEAIQELAKRSRFNPRVALQNLAFSLEILTVKKKTKLTSKLVDLALTKLNIDKEGLTDLDRKYLEILSPTRPTGMSQLKAVLGTNHQTIESEIEPFLLRMGYIERTPKGRIRVENLEQLLKKSIEEIQRDRVYAKLTGQSS